MNERFNGPDELGEAFDPDHYDEAEEPIPEVDPDTVEKEITLPESRPTDPNGTEPE
jgi:hypothetical protein